MLIYYTVYSATLFTAYAGRQRASLNRSLYWITLIFLMLFSSLRFEVGCDWTGYYNNFAGTPYLSWEGVFEHQNPSHWGLIKLIREAERSYLWLNFVPAAIFFFGLHRLARRQPDPLAFLVFCFPILIINMPMSAIKQAAAIGFLCLAYCAFIDRRPFLYAFWILLGWSFHSSIMLFLLFTPFVIGKFNRINVFIALILASPGAYLLLQTEAADTAAQRYIDTGLDASGAAFRLGILTLSGAFFLWKLAPRWRRVFPKDYKIAAIGAWTMVVFFSLFFVSTVIGDRFGYYLIPLQSMIFARIPYLSLGRERQLYAIMPYALLTLVFVVWTQLSWHFDQCYIPYQFWFG